MCLPHTAMNAKHKCIALFVPPGQSTDDTCRYAGTTQVVRLLKPLVRRARTAGQRVHERLTKDFF